MENIYDFVVEKNTGETYKLEDYKDYVMLIVNTASECGFTPQFEPGSGEEAAQNCKLNYGVTFPIHQKIDVKGEHQHPLFRFLTDAQQGMFNEKIKWNFTKFLIDRDGNVVKRFSPQKKPAQLENEIEKLL